MGYEILGKSYAFDDLLLVPKMSEVRSRAQVDLSVKLCKDFIFSGPVVPSNMASICELEMARLMYQEKNMAIFHRFTTFENQLEWLEEVKSWHDGLRYVGFSIGVKEEDYKNVDTLVERGAQIILIDVAHGWSVQCLEMTRYVSSKYPHVLLISGNSAEGKGAAAIWQAGADVVKNGVGMGAICLTRIVSGNGVASLSSLMSCYDYKSIMQPLLKRPLFFMNDGGCAAVGSIAKALCFADMCMAGNMFAATTETPGEIITINEISYKQYNGSSTHKNGVHKEGVEALKILKGSAKDVLRQIRDGLSSCCSYQGVFNLTDLKQNPKFMEISLAGIKESGAHNLDIVIK